MLINLISPFYRAYFLEFKMSWQELMSEAERLSREGDKLAAEKLRKQALELKRKNDDA